MKNFESLTVGMPSAYAVGVQDWRIRTKRKNVNPNLLKRRKVEDNNTECVATDGGESIHTRKTIQQQGKLVSTPKAMYTGQGNRFQAIANISTSNAEIIEAWRRTKERDSKTSLISDGSSEPGAETGTLPEQKKKNKIKLKIPPIFVYEMQVNDSIQLLKKVLKIEDFVIKRYNNKMHAIRLNNLNDFEITKKQLSNVSADYYSFTAKNEKIKSMLLKGVDPETDINYMLEELKSYNDEDIQFLSIKKFQTVKSKIENRALPIFIVQLSPESRMQKLKSIRSVASQIVTWEKIKKQEMTQCKRCQYIGHTAINCGREYRCVKCEIQHEPGQCQVQKSNELDRSMLYCCLCKQKGHPASYRGCPKYLELKSRLKAKKNDIKTYSDQRNRMFNNFVNESFSYANIARGERENQPQPKNIPVADTNNLQQNFINEIKNMLSNIQSQLMELKNKFEEEKSRVDAIMNIFHKFKQQTTK